MKSFKTIEWKLIEFYFKHFLYLVIEIIKYEFRKLS